MLGDQNSNFKQLLQQIVDGFFPKGHLGAEHFH